VRPREREFPASMGTSTRTFDAQVAPLTTVLMSRSAHDHGISLLAFGRAAPIFA
jgi:hypothetical protein